MDTDYSTQFDDQEDEQPTSNMPWDELEQWADSTNSDRVIAVAIIAVSEESEDPARTPTAIWYDPTAEEQDRVVAKAREELTYHAGNYVLSEDGTYLWGDEPVDLGIRDED